MIFINAWPYLSCEGLKNSHQKDWIKKKYSYGTGYAVDKDLFLLDILQIIKKCSDHILYTGLKKIRTVCSEYNTFKCRFKNFDVQILICIYYSSKCTETSLCSINELECPCSICRYLLNKLLYKTEHNTKFKKANIFNKHFHKHVDLNFN